MIKPAWFEKEPDGCRMRSGTRAEDWRQYTTGTLLLRGMEGRDLGQVVTRGWRDLVSFLSLLLGEHVMSSV